MHPHLRKAAIEWLHERLDWPNPSNTAGLLLNQKGARLSTRSAHEIITRIAAAAGLEYDHITAHVLRHTFATTLVRGGTDIVIVAELLGHNRLETTRVYTQPTHEDRSKAITLLTTDA